MTHKGPDWRRRGLLAAGGAAIVGWVIGAPHLASIGDPDLAFEELAGLEPFRRLVGTGAASTANAAFFGLDAPEPVSHDDARLIQSVRADPCAAFFANSASGSVPVAMFSDFACPVCRVMENRLQELKAEDPDSFHIVRHQLPILSAASRTASRAVLAAQRQGAYPQMHARLLRTPAVTDDAYVIAIAQSIGLDAEQFKADLASDAIDQELRVSKAIADVFGFYGTPAFAVGRTVFIGSISKASLRSLIAQEVENPCQDA